ncbi:hypothetical protein GWI33_007705 [Rhynchophorus ferrugineus]|uniref:Uncharacterized protein n=1 Tax=Rhynchophorus ferrugineus TaxID=354439 RepID=A0A834MCV3_RHYFE|nr:hypothetical protein GWI33_007705 [Rhynchophorus ferrugineus]
MNASNYTPEPWSINSRSCCLLIGIRTRADNKPEASDNGPPDANNNLERDYSTVLHATSFCSLHADLSTPPRPTSPSLAVPASYETFNFGYGDLPSVPFPL